MLSGLLSYKVKYSKAFRFYQFKVSTADGKNEFLNLANADSSVMYLSPSDACHSIEFFLSSVIPHDTNSLSVHELFPIYTMVEHYMSMKRDN